MKTVRFGKTVAVAVGLGLVVGSLFINMQAVAPTTFPYSRLTSVSASTKLCTLRPSAAGLPYYNAMTSNRSVTGQGLNDIEILTHSATRLGFGLSSLGPIVPSKANDCTTVFLAEEIARQLGLIGTNADSSYVTRIRQGLIVFSNYPRKDLDKLMTRFTADPSDATIIPGSTAHGMVWYQARQDVARLMILRNLFGSQNVSGTTIVDHQINLQDAFAEFWYNHFNIDNSKSEQYASGNDSLPEAMRSSLGGTFYSLLYKVVHHPSMLRYLDNHDSHYVCTVIGTATTCAASNQNLARELMELHTFGVGPATAQTVSPYTQIDVEAMANILAGFNVVPYTDPTNPGQYIFNSTLAANVPQKLIGVTYSTTGDARLISVLKMLANHAKTKSNICGKMADYLFHSSVAASGVAACVAAWGTDGVLGAMYAAMLKSPAFWSKSNYHNLYRTPIEAPIAAARGLGMNMVDLRDSVVAAGLSHTPFNPLTVTVSGYVAANNTLKASREWWMFTGIANETRSLLGVYRGEVALPIGYSLDGYDHLSSSFVEQSSRLGFEISVYLEGMNGVTRKDIVSPSVLTTIAGLVSSKGLPYAQQYYFENQMQAGRQVNFATVNSGLGNPYLLPASQQAIFNSVMASSVKWPFWTGNNITCVHKAMALMSISNTHELLK